MGQNANRANVAINPSNVSVPLKTDTQGDLYVTIRTPGQANPTTYVEVAASGNTTLGGNGTVGDVLNTIIVSPNALASGNVSLRDGNTVIPIFVDVGNLTDTRPTVIPIGAPSKSGAWGVITGGNVTVMAIGQFTP